MIAQYVQTQKRACISVVAECCQSFILVCDIEDPLEGYTQLLACITEDIARYDVYKSRVYTKENRVWWRYIIIQQDDLLALMQHMHTERLCLHHLMDKWHYLFSTLYNDRLQSKTGWYFVAWQGQLHQFLVIEAHIVVQQAHVNPSTNMVIQEYNEAPISVLSWYIGPVDGFRDRVFGAATTVGAECHEVQISLDKQRFAQSACKISYRHRYRMCFYMLLLSAILGLTTIWLSMSIHNYRVYIQPAQAVLSETSLEHIIQLVKYLPNAMPTQTMIRGLLFTEKNWQLIAAYRQMYQAKEIADRLGPKWRCHRRQDHAHIMCSRKHDDH